MIKAQELNYILESANHEFVGRMEAQPTHQMAAVEMVAVEALLLANSQTP